MTSKVLDVALDKFSKKYPNFSAESGRKVVDSLQDAYKSYKVRKQTTSDGKSAPENHALINIPQDSPSPSSSPDKARRDSFYENFEEYNDQNPSSKEGTQKFPSEPQSNGIKLEGDTSSPSSAHQLLSNNPPTPSTKPDCEKPLNGDPAKPPETSGAPRTDISQYLQKKSLAQGMMDLALLSANTNQLRYILDSRSDNLYFSVSLTLIISSLVLQIVVGMMLVWNSSYNVQRRSGFASADRINNLSVFGVFLITLINVFVSTFGNVPAAASSSTATTTVAPKIEGGGGTETTIMSIVSSVAPAAVDVPPPADPVDVPFE